MPWFENQWLSKSRYPWLFAQDYTLEYETIRYFLNAQNSGTPSTLNPFTVNEDIKALKNGSAVTLNSVTANLSTVNGTAFISNPSVDLRPYLGFVLTFNDGSKTAAATAWQAGTGETLSGVVPTNNGFETGDPPSNWNTFGCINSRQADPRPGGSGSYALQVDGLGTDGNPRANQNFLSIGGLYKYNVWAKNVDATSMRMMATGSSGVNLGNTASWNNFTGYRVAANVPLYLVAYKSDGTGTALFDDVDIQQVLTPSALGLTLGAAGAQNWGTIQSGFNPNATSYILIITRS